MRYRLRTLLIVFLFGPPIVYGLVQAASFVRAKQLEAVSRNNGMVYPGRQERVFIGR
jgi:phosphohistidine swiveling domain-containing protein